MVESASQRATGGHGDLPRDDEGLTSIGELARTAGITPRTLRFYQSKGLLAPFRRGRSRRFTAEDRVRLTLILQGVRLGFTLNEIRDMLKDAAGGLSISREKCVEQIRLLERRQHEIECALAELGQIYDDLY